jgi:hypothetical protein
VEIEDAMQEFIVVAPTDIWQLKASRYLAVGQ